MTPTLPTRFRRRAAVLLGAVVLTGSLAACSASSADGGSADPLVVIASSVPHSEILKEVQKEGLLGDTEIEIKEISGDIDANQLLEGGDVDANYFQHDPYLQSWSAEHDVDDLVNVATVHVEPLGVYSEKVEDLANIEAGSTVALSNNVSNFARGLFLLQDAEVLKLDVAADTPNLDYSQVTEKNIVDNPHNLQFVQIDPAQLPNALTDAKIALSVINGNYALEAGLNPSEDALALETVEGNPYANTLTVKKELADDPRVKDLAKALESAEIAKWIDETYKGSVIAVNGAK